MTLICIYKSYSGAKHLSNLWILTVAYGMIIPAVLVEENGITSTDLHKIVNVNTHSVIQM